MSWRREAKGGGEYEYKGRAELESGLASCTSLLLLQLLPHPNYIFSHQWPAPAVSYRQLRVLSCLH